MSSARLQAGHLSPATIKAELVTLRKELKEVEDDIIAVTQVVRGLSVVLGEEKLSPELLRLIHPERTNVRGLSQACRSVLQSAARACSLREIYDQIMASAPELLIHLRNPKASVMSVLRHLAKRGDIIRGKRNGKSVWQRLDSQLPPGALNSGLRQHSFDIWH